MTDNKQEILETRIGGLGSSDAPMVYRIGSRGFLSDSDKFRIAVMLGLAESKIFSTEATRRGTDIEDRIFEALKTMNKKFVSNPKYVSESLTQKYGFSIFNHIDFELETETEILWYENKAVLEQNIEFVKDKYICQLSWHMMLLKEKAGALKKTPELYLMKYDTNNFDILDALNPDNIDHYEILYKRCLPYISVIEEGLRIIKECIPTFEYVEPETLDAEVLPQVQIDYMNSIAVRLEAIKKHEIEIDEFKEKMYDLMVANDIKSIKHDSFNMTVVSETTTTTFDSKKFKEDKPKLYDKYKKVGKKKGYLKITLKGEKE